MSRENIKVDEIFITGDFRHAGIQKEEAKFENYAKDIIDFVLKLSDAVGIVDTAHIHIIQGNHDKVRDEKNKKRLNEIKNNYNPMKGTLDTEDIKFLNSQFLFFDIIYKTLYGKDNPQDLDKIHSYEKLDGKCRLIKMNTAIMHNSDEDRGQLIIGNDQLDLIFEEAAADDVNLPIIVLAHHPLKYFQEDEREAVVEIFKEYKPWLYLCGDEHRPSVHKIENTIEVTMGCQKLEEGRTKPSILFGDTETNEFRAFHWVDEWEPYAEVNRELTDYLTPETIDTLNDFIQELQEQLGMMVPENLIKEYEGRFIRINRNMVR